MSGSMANYSIGNTPAADANKLQWVKIVDGDKTLLICDRVILVSVSWDDLNGQGYISGKEITIDGARYKCRLLTAVATIEAAQMLLRGYPLTTSGTDSSPVRRSSLGFQPSQLRPLLDTQRDG
jgi:hypothetical protein